VGLLSALAGAQWALWLVAPLIIPVVFAIALWWHGRPRRPATIPESIAGHRAYLRALDAATQTGAQDRVTRGG
jgi:hypothetical protein